VEWVIGADVRAARWVFDSAQQLDRVDPIIAYHGISLALKSHEVVESWLPGFQPPEIVPAATRSQYLAEVFTAHLEDMGTPREQAEERRDSARDIVATLDLVLQAAVESGELDPSDIRPSLRWQRHMRRQTGASNRQEQGSR
jgi:hypothetical protein